MLPTVVIQNLDMINLKGLSFSTPSTCIVEGLANLKFQGGMAGAERLHKSRVLKKMLKEQGSAGRMYGAICSSPMVLNRQGLLKVS